MGRSRSFATSTKDRLTLGPDLLTLGQDLLTLGQDLLTLGQDLLTLEQDRLTLGQDLLSLEQGRLTECRRPFPPSAIGAGCRGPEITGVVIRRRFDFTG
jgi:hypothetical protein